MTTWKELKEDLDLTEEEKRIIKFEEDIIRTMVKIREEQGLTQADLAKLCNVKQPTIARMEKDVHSPQIDSLLRVLIPMGYTLQIVPVNQ